MISLHLGLELAQLRVEVRAFGTATVALREALTALDLVTSLEVCYSICLN